MAESIFDDLNEKEEVHKLQGWSFIHYGSSEIHSQPESPGKAYQSQVANSASLENIE